MLVYILNFYVYVPLLWNGPVALVQQCIDNLAIVTTWRIHCKYMGNLKTITLFNIAKPHDSKVLLE